MKKCSCGVGSTKFASVCQMARPANGEFWGVTTNVEDTAGSQFDPQPRVPSAAPRALRHATGRTIMRGQAELSQSPADEVREIVASCTQCGICDASCPTYILDGDQRDGPRGRITMIGEMFRATDMQPTVTARRHIGRCLSCMACVTDCPAGVDYGRLIQHAKSHLRVSATSTPRARLIEWAAIQTVPYPRRLGWMMRLAPMLKPVARVLRWFRMKDLARLAEVVPSQSSSRPAFSGPGTAATTRERRGRVILLAGCAQQVLRPAINDATIRLLARSGIDVEVAAGAGCCGRPASQIGDLRQAQVFARANIDAWSKAIARTPDAPPIDAIVFNSAGCGAEVKGYPQLLADDPAYAERATEIAALARDVAEFLGTRGLGPPRRWSSLKIAYQAPCALHHAQSVVDQPGQLIYEAGFTVVTPRESGVCCGAGGAYAFAEPEIANALRNRKLGNITELRPDVIATGSISCLKHLQDITAIPVVHTVELLDWAHGGPIPANLQGFEGAATDVPGPPPLDVDDYIRS